VVNDAEPRPEGKRRRAVILVGNPANPYSRAIRIGRTLVANGYEVEIAAPIAEGAAEREHDGPLVIRRYRPSGMFARLAATYRGKPALSGSGTAAANATATVTTAKAPASRRSVLRRIASRARQMARRLRRTPTRILRNVRRRSIMWFLWPHTVRGWWHTLERALAPADLYHACGVLAIPAALAARKRDRRAGRRSRVIHDVIDLQLESNNVLEMPRLIRRLLTRRERGWARAADAHTAVNVPFAERAAHLWGLSRVPAVVPNYPEPWTPPAGGSPDRIRERLGLSSTTRICLFWGRLGPYVGLDEMAESILLVPDAVLVVLGFGRGWGVAVARDADPRFVGRHFTLPAVHPDHLLSWVASADVAMITLPPLSYNQRYTTPNKFLEALAAGTPIVLGPDLPTMAGILEHEAAGRVAASMAPADIAAAISSILDRPDDERRNWRLRLSAAARERYSWPIAARTYDAVVRRVESLDRAGSAV
jgi:glycosyltransferase involved in cell wall biosynthesis